MKLNWPENWPTPPPGWIPPAGWKPDPSWPPPPSDWQLWEGDGGVEPESTISSPTVSAPAENGDSVTSAPAEPVTGITEVELLRARVAHLEQQLAVQGDGGVDVVDVSEQRVLQDVGIYRYQHPLDDSPAYKDRLAEINRRIDAMVKSGEAILAADMFTWNGSLARGRALVRDLAKLMLRAYNAEADNCVRSLRSGNIVTATKRLEQSVRSIEKLGLMMELRINPAYHQLRVTELELVADYQMKIQEERERAREERELLREQRKVEAELAAERARLEKERTHYITVLANLRASGDEAAAGELASRLDEIDAAIAANDYRAANIRAGYVYVISNVGAFGPNMVKIGLTRRLEPRDRIRELGDASVPFGYDTHALFFSDDAVSLENELHAAFANRRVNCVNPRREFFFASPQQVCDVLSEKVGGLLEYTERPEAIEYHQSRGSWPHAVPPEAIDGQGAT